MKVHDLIVHFDAQFGRHHIWQVESVCLGAQGQESLVELRSLTEAPGVSTDSQVHHTT